ncbi:hypothetical protein G7Y89_g10936 [Cudoniella acicularis]|uniref:2EXR domain-containing protein n=1 Tax=Cudoniella acicularis TaxID=354080 RepID=A0A8H4VYI7_9HELO|nr:hypothetical protein G7Y89_g10936 [Cudoniella acicularis]
MVIPSPLKHLKRTDKISRKQNTTTRTTSKAPKPKLNSHIRTPSFKHFPELPLELRLKIWTLALLQPRTINLQILVSPHPKYDQSTIRPIPTAIGPRHKYFELDATPQRIQFRCSVLPPTKPVKERYLHLDKNHPLGRLEKPVILYVCVESRRLALANYEPAFGDRELDREGERRVWVDFKRDMVLLNALGRKHYGNYLEKYFALGTLTAYCKNDAPKIRNLGIAGFWFLDTEPESPPWWWRSTSIMKDMIGLPGWLNSFGCLEKLYLWDDMKFRAPLSRGIYEMMDYQEVVKREVVKTLERLKIGRGWDPDRKLLVIRVLGDKDRVWSVVKDSDGVDRSIQPAMSLLTTAGLLIRDHPYNYTVNSSQECTLDTCSITQAQYLYDPSLSGNAFLASFFGLLLIFQLFLGIYYRTIGFCIATSIGFVLEIIGYIGRVQMHFNPFIQQPFMMALICVTIGPIFLTAAIYLCLSRIIVVYGTHLSRLSPGTVAISFMVSDFISLLLQAGGGAVVEIADDFSVEHVGIRIMVAGLSLQVVSLGVLLALCVDFAFRIFELSGGFHGTLWNDQVDFMVLDGTMVALAGLCLTVFHPGIAFHGYWETADYKMKALQHAVSALGALHEHLESQRFSQDISSISNENLNIDYATQQYTRALTSLRNILTKPDNRSIELSLISALLCMYYELLQENFETAQVHLENCLNVLNPLLPSQGSWLTNSLGGKMHKSISIDEDIVQEFAHLDIEASCTLGKRAPSMCLAETTLKIPTPFISISQARQLLYGLTSQLHSFMRYTADEYKSKILPVPLPTIAEANFFQARLKEWESSFSSFLSNPCTKLSRQEQQAANVLSIQEKVTYMKAATCLYAEEMIFDQFDQEFEEILCLADYIIYTMTPSPAKDVSSSSSINKVILTFDMGIIEALFWTAIKCRSPSIRHRAIDILRKVTWQEGVWNAEMMVAMAEKFVATEEEGFEEEEDNY